MTTAITTTTPNAITTTTTTPNPAAVYLAGLGASSRRTMQSAIVTIADILRPGASPDDVPWHLLRHSHLMAIRSELASRYAPSTANRLLTALRGVMRSAWRLRLIDSDEYLRAVDVRAIAGGRLPAGRDVPAGELAALLGTCGQTSGGIRDAAIIAILYSCGLRRDELVSADIGDYDAAAGTLRVIGKGNKQRPLPIVNGTAAALGDWLAVRGTAPGPLFTGTGNRQRGGRLTAQAIYNMLKRRAAAAGIPNLSPHDMRRSFVGELLERGADIATVQALAGHANVTTTARYDRRGDATRRRAAELIHIPHTPRTLAQSADAVKEQNTNA